VASLRMIEDRIAKLEKVMGKPDDMLVVVLDWRTGGEILYVDLWDSLAGCAVEGFHFEPKPGESEVDLIERAKRVVKASPHAHAAIRHSRGITLNVQRTWPTLEAKPQSEPTPVGQIEPKTTIKPKIIAPG